MKTAAVICELNPFHNGHARIFRKLREEYGADRVIAIMSGNYVQRGEPAVFDKYVRARMALVGDGGDVRVLQNTGAAANAGVPVNEPAGGYADLVLELPVVFATSSAHEFAAAGVRLAAATGVVDMLGFGIEPPATLGTLGELAQRMDEASSMQEAGAEDAAPEDASADGAASEIAASKDCSASSRRLRELLASGMTYPAALSEAYGIEGLTPNNILAVEYLRALQALKAEEAAAGRSCSRITPVAIIRTGDDYNASEVSNPDYTSASALRAELYAEKAFTYSAVPAALHPLYRELIEGRHALYLDAFTLLLESRILAAAHNLPHANPLSCYLDVSREIADRLMRHADRP
ncbi:MAG: nucleotidyltransferase family protein, partial [Lachnospiraceae bacterium]|nr:nucleotidyltransferase family protein [Lachnospiraceae bacterium]